MKLIFFFIAALFLASGCKPGHMPGPDPEKPDPNDLMKLLVGMKYQYAVGQNSALFNAITISGLITKEVSLKTGGIIDLVQLQSGGSSILSNNSYITGLWTTLMSINGASQRVMNTSLKMQDRDMARSIYAFSAMYRALSLGTAAAFWDSIPLQTGRNMVFHSRKQALLLATLTLDSAYDSLIRARVPDQFYEKIGREIDMKNSILVLSARYYNMLGLPDSAISKAMKAEIGQGSVYLYNNENFNPIYYYGISNTVGFRSNPNFGLPILLTPDSADKRESFYLSNDGRSGFFLSTTTRIPIFLQGEILLVLAESFLKKGNAAKSKKYLDELLVKQPAQDLFGVGAGLEPLPANIGLENLRLEIFKNRSIELYMNGMRLEDARRMGIDTAIDKRVRNYLPYPQVERDGNFNTPVDPLF